jgi:hypothetical protein
MVCFAAAVAALAAACTLDAAEVADKAGSNRLGVGMECLDRDLWDPFPAMPHLKELGIRKVRLQSGWARTEKEKGKYDFEWLDKVVAALGEIGVTPWISLSYGNPLYAAPEEGEQDYTGQKMFPMRSEAGKAAWAAYVTAIVKRYGNVVREWEIWNEPDVKFFLKIPAGSSWAKEYAQFLKFTSGIVRAAQPDAVVIACTACGPGSSGTAELFSEGIADFVDVYSFHAYTAIPEQMTSAIGKAFFSSVRKRAPKVEFWRGEAGISSVKSGFGALSELPLSEEMQARWMGRHLVRDLADPDISFTSWFHLSAFEHFSHTRTYHYGVLREKDYSHKPSFDVLKRIKQFFDDGRVAPDSSASLSLRPLRDASSADQAKVVGSAVYGFRRNGVPMFAFTSSWPAHEEMQSVKATASLFTGEPGCAWRDPVVLDLTSGEVRHLKPGSPTQTIEIANHVRVLAEAEALAPHIMLESRAAKQADGAPAAQADHE